VQASALSLSKIQADMQVTEKKLQRQQKAASSSKKARKSCKHAKKAQSTQRVKQS
jgi:hypothetical protein